MYPKTKINLVRLDLSTTLFSNLLIVISCLFITLFYAERLVIDLGL